MTAKAFEGGKDLCSPIVYSANMTSVAMMGAAWKMASVTEFSVSDSFMFRTCNRHDKRTTVTDMNLN